MIELLIKRIQDVECWIRNMQNSSGTSIPNNGLAGQILSWTGSAFQWINNTGGGGGGGATQTVELLVSEDGQTIFPGAIPLNKTVESLFVEGILQVKENINIPNQSPAPDYRVNGQNIEWISNDPAELEAGFAVSIVYF